MTLPASGAISLNAVNTELGVNGQTPPITINHQYCRNLAGVLTSDTTISLSNFYGKTWDPPGAALANTISLEMVKVDSSGNIYVAGAITGSSWWVAKLNSARVIQWQRTLTVARLDSIDIDSSGNLYAFGGDSVSAAAAQGFILVKYNTSGVLQWQRRYGGIASSWYGSTVAVNQSSGTVAYVGSPAGFNGPAYMVYYSAAGVHTFTRSIYCAVVYSGNSYSVAIDSSGNIFWGGQIDNNVSPYTKGFLIKYNSTGTLQWQIAYQYRSSYVTSIDYDTAGNVYASISADQTSVAKINTSGTVQWQRIVNSNVGNSIVAVEKSTGNVYYADRTGMLAKYNTSGVLQWQRKILISAVAMAITGITLDASGNIFVAGGKSVLKVSPSGGGIGIWGNYTIQTNTFAESADSTSWATLTGCTFGTGTQIAGTPTYTDAAASNTITVVI